MSKPCPKPWKVAYDEAGARWQVRAQKRDSHQNKKLRTKLCAYPCECGSWHVGHDKYRGKQYGQQPTAAMVAEARRVRGLA